MNRIFKKILNPGFYLRLPGIIKYRLMRIYHEKFIFKKSASREKVFRSIWNNNYWGNEESRSGPGATLVQTQQLRDKAPKMFQEFRIKSLFDAPCGDMNWMKHILESGSFNYLGGDIVSEIIDKNSLKFKNENINFTKFDITSDSFPDADVWICRAVFYHFSNQDILLALELFFESVQSSNADCIEK